MSKTIHNGSKTREEIAHHLLPITKSEYLQYLACAPEFWYLKHRPEEFSCAPDEETLHALEEGKAVEKLAHDYFIASEDLHVAFQLKFHSTRLFARADIVLTDIRTGIRTLIEVKSSSKIKDEHIHDLAFQTIAAETVGARMDQMGILHVNGNYVRSGDIDIRNLFVYENVTDRVLAQLPATRENIEIAIAYLQQNEPIMDLHEYCGQKIACPVLQKQHGKLPDYTVFDISRIGQSKLQELLRNGIVDIQQVPRNFKLSEIQRLQVDVAQSGTPYIRQQNIRQALDDLRFPLYFLDYEALHYGIPLYQGIKPHQQMVFQWSLHVLYEDGHEPEHFDFLSDGSGHPALEFVQALHAAIPNDGGSVLVWYKPFETARNTELAAMYPEFDAFLLGVNERIFDLMEIFQKQHYVHPAFKGSNSIKDVLPVLAPHLSYSGLPINHGNLATIRWFELVMNEMLESEKRKILYDLRQYCKLDTLAMVEVYKHLRLFTSIAS